MTTNPATFLLTPPLREAVTELAHAFADWSMNDDPGEARGRRLLRAQEVLGIELVNSAALAAYVGREAA